MELKFGPRGKLIIDDAQIIYKNFSGAPSLYNRQGDRNFSLIIPDEKIKDALVEEGWNVKIKPPYMEGDKPRMILPVKVKFSEYGPTCYMKNSKGLIKLNEESICDLDRLRLSRVDLDIRPFDWEVNGQTGRTAYLDSICVEVEEDRFAARYAEDVDYSEAF